MSSNKACRKASDLFLDNAKLRGCVEENNSLGVFQTELCTETQFARQIPLHSTLLPRKRG
jgi:hypothetical protein